MPTAKRTRDPAPPGELKRERWEYLVRHQTEEGYGFLTALGEDGWELVSVVMTANGIREFYFMRPKY